MRIIEELQLAQIEAKKKSDEIEDARLEAERLA